MLLRREAGEKKLNAVTRVFGTFNCLPIYLAREERRDPRAAAKASGGRCCLDRRGTLGLPSSRGRLQLLRVGELQVSRRADPVPGRIQKRRHWTGYVYV